MKKDINKLRDEIAESYASATGVLLVVLLATWVLLVILSFIN